MQLKLIATMSSFEPSILLEIPYSGPITDETLLPVVKRISSLGQQDTITFKQLSDIYTHDGVPELINLIEIWVQKLGHDTSKIDTISTPTPTSPSSCMCSIILNTDLTLDMTISTIQYTQYTEETERKPILVPGLSIIGTIVLSSPLEISKDSIQKFLDNKLEDLIPEPYSEWVNGTCKTVQFTNQFRTEQATLVIDIPDQTLFELPLRQNQIEARYTPKSTPKSTLKLTTHCQIEGNISTRMGVTFTQAGATLYTDEYVLDSSILPIEGTVIVESKRTETRIETTCLYTIPIPLETLHIPELEDTQFFIPTGFIKAVTTFKQELGILEFSTNCEFIILGPSIIFSVPTQKVDTLESLYPTIIEELKSHLQQTIRQDVSSLDRVSSVSLELKSFGFFKKIVKGLKKVGNVISDGAKAVLGAGQDIIGGVLNEVTGNRKRFEKLRRDINQNSSDIEAQRKEILQIRDTLKAQQAMIVENQDAVTRLELTQKQQGNAIIKNTELIKQTKEQLLHKLTKQRTELEAKRKAMEKEWGASRRQTVMALLDNQIKINLSTSHTLESLSGDIESMMRNIDKLKSELREIVDDLTKKIEQEVTKLNEKLDELDAQIHKNMELLEQKFALHISAVQDELDSAELRAKREIISIDINFAMHVLLDWRVRGHQNKSSLASRAISLCHTISGEAGKDSLFDLFISSKLDLFGNGSLHITEFKSSYISELRNIVVALQIYVYLFGHAIGIPHSAIEKHLSKPRLPETSIESSSTSAHTRVTPYCPTEDIPELTLYEYGPLWIELLRSYQTVIQAAEIYRFNTNKKVNPAVIKTLNGMQTVYQLPRQKSAKMQTIEIKIDREPRK